MVPLVNMFLGSTYVCRSKCAIPVVEGLNISMTTCNIPARQIVANHGCMTSDICYLYNVQNHPALFSLLFSR